MSASARYAGRVFINCPFDPSYRPLFNAIIFAILDCGFAPRSALEIADSSQVRIEKIQSIIGDCKFSVHDLSRTELDKTTKLPRFNMPFELGIFLGAKRFGDGKQKDKNALILDIEQYRYQAFLSDIAGQDIRAHNSNKNTTIRIIRDWLAAASKRRTIPSGSVIRERYAKFQRALPRICAGLDLNVKELTYGDYLYVAGQWLTEAT